MQTTMTVTGMHCASCKALLEDVLGEVPGVTACTIDPARGTGTIEHDASFSFAAAQKAVAELREYTIKKI